MILRLRRRLITLLYLVRRRRQDLGDAAALRHVGDAAAAVRAVVVVVGEPVQAAGEAGQADADDAQADAGEYGHARVGLVHTRQAPASAVGAVYGGGRGAQEV